MSKRSHPLDAVSKASGHTFEQWMVELDRAYGLILGMGSDDGGDAPWWDYWNDEMTVIDAMAHALHDWQDEAGILDLDALGLGGRV